MKNILRNLKNLVFLRNRKNSDLKIHFKNVGHGDSIIIEWWSKLKKKSLIGIMDVCRTENGIPTKDYIYNKKYKNIEFAILSHFHIDHFSGYKDFLEFAYKNDIKIKLFCNTFQPEFLDILGAYESKSAFTKIGEFIEYAGELKDNGTIEKKVNIYDTTQLIPLGKNSKLKFLAPYYEDHDELIKEINNFSKKRRTTRPTDLYHKVCTAMAIISDNSFALLTSDIMKETFDKIKRDNNFIQELKLILAQSPHHGSKHNHNENFWKEIPKNKNCPIVISCGKNDHHSLPDLEVIESFVKNGFKIYTTNNVYGIKKYIESSSKSISDSSISTLNFTTGLIKDTSEIINSDYQGDKVFRITSNNAILET